MVSLFSAISNNWKGVPLNSYKTIIKYMRKTKTTPKKGPGLKVKATLVRKRYKNGQKVSDKEMSQLQLENHDTLPNWSYVSRTVVILIITALTSVKALG